MKYIVDIKGEIEGDYEIIGKYEERPQGEWETTKAYPHKVYCGKCFKTYAQENWEVWKDGSLPRNFCPNCGAEMKEGEDHEVD